MIRFPIKTLKLILKKDFKLIKDNKVFAHTSGFDGFYMALLEKNNN